MPRSDSRPHFLSSRAPVEGDPYEHLRSSVHAFISHLDQSPHLTSFVPGAEQVWQGQIAFSRPSRSEPPEIDVYSSTILQFAELAGSRVPVSTLPYAARAGVVVHVPTGAQHRSDLWVYRGDDTFGSETAVPGKTLWSLKYRQGGRFTTIDVSFHAFQGPGDYRTTAAPGASFHPTAAPAPSFDLPVPASLPPAYRTPVVHQYRPPFPSQLQDLPRDPLDQHLEAALLQHHNPPRYRRLYSPLAASPSIAGLASELYTSNGNRLLKLRIRAFLAHVYLHVHGATPATGEARWVGEITVLFQGIWQLRQVQLATAFPTQRHHYALLLPGQEYRLKITPFEESHVHPAPIYHNLRPWIAPDGSRPFLHHYGSDEWTFNARYGSSLSDSVSHDDLHLAIRTTWTLRTGDGELVLVNFVARNPYEAWMEGQATALRDVEAFEVGKAEEGRREKRAGRGF
ncbi:hypothetical protein JCM8097_008336 [Rhodosporidiobolus ruineniae]